MPGIGMWRLVDSQDEQDSEKKHCAWWSFRRSTAVQLQHRLLAVRGVQVSETTIKRRLVESGLTFRRPATGSQLLLKHRKARQWNQVLFNDESRFCLRSPDGRQRLWRRRDEGYAECTISERVSFNGGSVMVWADISAEAHTDLILVENGALNVHGYVKIFYKKLSSHFPILLGMT